MITLDKNEISVSILNADFYNLKNSLDILRQNDIKYLHLDVMDGIFVPNISFGMPVIESLKKSATEFVFDTHLMITEPEKYIDDFVRVGSDIITIHTEATHYIDKCIEKIKNNNIKVGLSIKPNTEVESIYKYLNNIDMVLIMSVYPGFGGQSFLEDSLSKVIKLKKYIDDNKLNVKIEIDGGINLNNVKKVIDAGVELVVIGSSIFRGDISTNIKNFKNIIN